MMKRLLFLVLLMFLAGKLSAQTSLEPDTLLITPEFSLSAAWEYVDHIVHSSTFWRTQEDSTRMALQRLLDHSTEPFDSVRSRLIKEDFTLIELEKGDPELADSFALKWINDSTFLLDSHGWSANLYMKNEVLLVYPEKDTSWDRLPLMPIDSTLIPDSSILSPAKAPIPDTILSTRIDTSAMEALGITMHFFSGDEISPSLDRNDQRAVMASDSSRINYYSMASNWKAPETSPFRILEGKHQLDSLQYAVDQILEFTLRRDSSLLWLNDMHGNKTPFWLNQGDDDAYRFWVKNFRNDSITIWLGNPTSHEISLMLDDDVSIKRLMKEEIHALPEFLEMPDRTLVSMSVLEPDPIYWNYNFGSVFTMNQTYLANWSKGGESSFSTILDILGEATYNNKDAKTQWISTMRLNFGTLSTKENGFRKNNDLFEINSKFNGNAWGKIGMSASFYMKNQVAKGYNYPNDSVVVSKFLNPSSLTLGLGFEYKPFKNTTLNIAPLSYKNTFVLDTIHIDQTKHGIDKEKRSKQEMGTQIVINNKVSPYKDLTIENRVRLFSGYLNNPQNIDVDWELILDQKINWFFTIRVNLHLIYDDDILFPVLDSEGSAIVLPDGSPKKVAKAQFKEFIGLSLQFKF